MTATKPKPAIDSVYNIPSKSHTTAVAHAVTQDLAGNDTVASKYGVQLLSDVSQTGQRESESKKWESDVLTDSVRRLGRLDR